MKFHFGKYEVLDSVNKLWFLKLLPFPFRSTRLCHCGVEEDEGLCFGYTKIPPEKKCFFTRKVFLLGTVVNSVKGS